MDLRLLPLLLLLAYASEACARTTRNSSRILLAKRRSGDLLQRSVRTISEFLKPPPLPSMYRHPRGFPAQFSSPRHRLRKASSSGNSNASNNVNYEPNHKLKQAAGLTGGNAARNGRYVNSQNADPDYSSNFINWLNPLVEVDIGAGGTKDSDGQDSSNFPRYAPHMPYTGASNEYGPAHPARTSSWTSGQSCNPCDLQPWTPVIHNDVNSYPGQYAANFGSNTYFTRPTTQFEDYQLSSGSRPSSGPTPPLHEAIPFRDTPKGYYSASSHEPLSLPAPPAILYQQENYNLQPHPVDVQPQAASIQHYSIDIQQSPIIDVQQSPIIDVQQSPIIDVQQSSIIDVQQSPIIDVQQSPIIDVQQSPIIDVQQSSIIDVQQSPSIDVDQTTIIDHISKPSTNLDLDNGSSQSFQLRQGAQQTKSTFFDLDVDVNNHHDAVEAESRPAFSTSDVSAPEVNTNVHFQRSPLVELSVAGESTPTRSNRFPTKATANVESSTVPTATVIDYIVSSRRKTSRPAQSRPSTTTTTTTAATTTTSTQRSGITVPDQKQQESHIESLVEAYEFYKNNNANRTKPSENDDFSASREVVAPNNSDSGKKIIQIIIPYTSQYTPSPFHPTKSVSQSAKQPGNHRSEETTPRHAQLELDNGDNSVEDNVLIEESRLVAVTRAPEVELVRKNQTDNAIDVHRLQKNIDNWTIQEYSKKSSEIRNLINATYPRWISSKQIPDEYLLATTEEDSNEYYDISQETQVHRGISTIQVTSTTTTTTTEATTRINVVNAIYPKSTKKPKSPSANNQSGEKVYVVTPIPNPNSLEVSPTNKDHDTRLKARKAKVKQDKVGLEQAYQVLPQAVNNLAVLANAPESAAPALWGIMEHEQIASSPNQPRWRSESDILPEPASTPVLYAGHSKVTYFRTKVH